MKSVRAKKTSENASSFLLSTFILSVSMVTVKVIGAFFKIPLMNLLGETGMAYFSGAYTVFTAVYAVTVSGLTGASSKLTSAYDALKADGNIIKLRRITVILYGAIGLLGMGVMLLGAKYFAVWIGCEMSAPSIMTASFAVLCCCLMAVYRGYFEGMNDMRPTAVSQVVEAFGKLIFGLLGAFLVLSYSKKCFIQKKSLFRQNAESLSDAISIAMPYAAAAVLFGISLSTLCGLLYLIIADRRSSIKRQPHPVKQSVPTKTLLHELLNAAFPIAISTVIMQLIPLIDTTTVFKQLSVHFLQDPAIKAELLSVLDSGETPEIFCFGIFSACTTLFNLIPTAAGLVSKIALPAASRLNAAGEKGKQKEYIRAVLLGTLYVTTPASFGMASISKLILNVLYQRQPYTALLGEGALQILGIAAVCSGIIFPLTAFLQAGKHFWSPIICQALGAGAKYIGNIYLIRRFGMTGISYATLAGYTVTAISLLLTAVYYFGNILPVFPVLKVFMISILSAFGAKTVSLRLAEFLSSNTVILILSIMAAVIIYLLDSVFFRPITKNMINLLSGKEKTAKGLEKIRIIG